MKRRGWNRPWSRAWRFAYPAVFLLCAATPGLAQSLRFENHRSITPPDYATLRVGPFYSSLAISQSVGYRYSASTGEGTDFLFENERGTILKDGSDFPLVTTLDTRNYLILTPTMDLDLSLRASYEFYPLNTQEDEFNLDLAEEGALGLLSTEILLSPFLRLMLFDRATYQTDYIDTRGFEDENGGSRDRYFENTAGANLDWNMAKDRNLAFSLARTDHIPFDEEFDDQERISYLESVAYERRFSPLLMGGLRAAFEQSEYPFSNRADTASQTYTAYSTAQLTRDTKGWASVGVEVTDIAEEDGYAVEPEGNEGIGRAGFETQLSRELSHRIEAYRTLELGFNSAFELQNGLSYGLAWKGDLVSWGIDLGGVDVEPSDPDVPGYQDINTGAQLTYPVTRIISLLFSTSYDMRNNEDVLPDAGLEPEWMEDYQTWLTKIGTGFNVTREVTFTAYYSHGERFSDLEDLAYQRDTVEATFTYTHRF